LAGEGFAVEGHGTQIVPLVVGDAAAAVGTCEAALERGVFAQAIRPPTVPEGTSRLRLAAMATHTPDELRAAARVLARAARQAGIRPEDTGLATVEHIDEAPPVPAPAAARGGASVGDPAPFDFEALPAPVTTSSRSRGAAGRRAPFDVEADVPRAA
jgi:glycine C-acetyltransferase/8-amino-7-oxononanoate synthase